MERNAAAQVEGQRRPGAESLPLLVGLGVAVLASLSWVQWWRPVIEHDDWINLLSTRWVPLGQHTTWVLTQGRWLNYWAWLGGEPHLDARATVLIFGAGWLLFAAVFVRAVTTGWWAVPLAVAVYSAPMTADAAYWPATLLAPMAALGIGALLLWGTRARIRLHLVVLVATTGLVVLGYPPFALMLPFLLVAIHSRESWKRLLLIGGTFVASYVGALVGVFALNDLRFGVFGVKIARWRHPTPLDGIGSLSHHLHVAAGDWRLLVEAILIPLVLSLVAFAVGLRHEELRRRFAVLATAAVISFGLSVAPTILQGVNVPFRSLSWVWLCLVLAVAWTAQAQVLRARSVGRIILVTVAAWGALYWADGVTGHQHFGTTMDRLENQAVALARQTGGQIVVAPRGLKLTPTEIDTAEQFHLGIAKHDGLLVKVACGTQCGAIHDYAQQHHLNDAVFSYRGFVVVRLPESLTRHQLDTLPKPWWLQPIPWASYVRQ